MIKDFTVIASSILVGIALGLLIFTAFINSPKNIEIVSEDCECYYEY